MKCPFCNNDKTQVIDKRESREGFRRRRECLKCRKRFTTYEAIEEPKIFVIKKDSRREPFSREKLRIGISKACEKRPVSQEEIDKIVSEIEQKLKEQGKEVNSKVIGEFVIKELKTLDKVAYVRFASVYREFADVSQFKKILSDLK